MKRITTLVAILSLFVAGRALAQTASVPASMEVPVTLSLDVSGGLAFNTTAITAADFDAGYRQSSTDLTVTHKGNVPHVIKVSASGTTLGFAPLAGRTETDPSKPASDLLLSKDAFVSSLAMGTTAQTLLTQGTATDLGTATIQARMNLGYTTTPPGTYSTTITFTIAES